MPRRYGTRRFVTTRSRGFREATHDLDEGGLDGVETPVHAIEPSRVFLLSGTDPGGELVQRAAVVLEPREARLGLTVAGHAVTVGRAPTTCQQHPTALDNGRKL